MNGHDYPQIVAAVDVVNSVMGPGLFSLPGGRAMYDEVWMADGGRALYLARIEPIGTAGDGWQFRVVRRWIPWETMVVQHYEAQR